MKLTVGAAALLAVALAASSTNNYVSARAFPQVSIAEISKGCSQVTLTVELKGPETEEWYCPKVEWEFPNGTRATEESDCAPFERRHLCAEDQTGCGWVGFTWNPVKKQYIDRIKECPCTITGYPRVWRKPLCVPPNQVDAPWSVWVRLSKGKKVLEYEEVRFWVK